MDETNLQSANAASSATLIPGGRSTAAGHGVTWISQGWSLFTKTPLIWVLNVVIFFVIAIVLMVIPIIGAIILYTLYGLFMGGMMLGAHAQHGGRALEVGDLFSGFNGPRAKPLFMVGVFCAVALLALMVIAAALFFAVVGASGGIGGLLSGGEGAMAGLAAGIGMGAVMVLLIVMAIAVPVSMAFWFAPTLVALNDVAPLDALKMSFNACLKNIVPFLLNGLVFLVLIIIGAIPFGLGLLVVIPLMFCSTYAAYRDIFLGDDGGAAA